MALQCNINKDLIKKNLENHVAEVITSTGLFNRIDHQTLINPAVRDDIDEAYIHQGDLPNVYQEMINTSPVDFMSFVADQSRTANNNAMILGTGLEAFPKELIATAKKLFPAELKVDDERQFHVDNINQLYEDIVLKQIGDGIYRTDFPTYILNTALKQALEANPDQAIKTKEQNQSLGDNNYTDEYLYEKAGIKMGDSPVDFLDRYSTEWAQSEEQIRKANPTVTIEFTDGASQFDPGSNRVVVSLREAHDLSLRTQLSFKKVLNFVTLHELAHAASWYAVETGPVFTQMNELLQLALKVHKTSAFKDEMRGVTLDEGDIPYSLNNVHEFVSDAFSNPYFKDWLKTIPYEGSSIWDRIVNFFRSVIGLGPKDTLYDKVIDTFNNDKIQKDNEEGSMTPWVQPLSAVVKVQPGNPKDYLDATYRYFTQTAVEKEIKEILTQLPDAMIRIKNRLKTETNQTEIRRLQTLYDAYSEVKGNEKSIPVYINMMITAAKIAQDLNKQLLVVDQQDDKMQIHALYSLFTAAENLEFITPFINQVLGVIDEKGPGPGMARFVTQLRGIVQVKDAINDQFIKKVSPPLLRYLSSLQSTNQTSVDLAERYRNLKKQLESTDDEKEKKYYSALMLRVREQMMKVPSSETLGKVFSGNYMDAVSSQMWLEAAILNSHPLVSVTAEMLKDVNIEITHDMLMIENQHQVQWTQVKKDANLNMRNPKETWKSQNLKISLRIPVKMVTDSTVGEDGEVVHTYKTTGMFLSHYSAQYLTQSLELQGKRDAFYKKILEAKRKGDEDEEKKWKAKYSGAIREQALFQKENSERMYKQEVYDMYELLDRDVKRDDGSITSFRQERGDIFAEIQDLEHLRDQADTVEDQKMYQDDIRTKYIELGQIRSPWDSNTGKAKTGFELELATIADEYSELRKKYGKLVPTPEGQASFEREMQYIQDRLDQGLIKQEEADAAFNDITASELSQEYFDKLNMAAELVAEATQNLIAIPDLASIFQQRHVDDIRDGYKKIRGLVAGFRDNEGTVNGQLFSKVRPQLIKEIQSIQQQTENLKQSASKLKGLSVEDSITLDKLVGKEKDNLLTEDEKKTLADLRAEKGKISAIYTKNKKVINAYYDLIKSLTSLTKSSVSKYYLQERDVQLNQLIVKERAKVKTELQTKNIIEGGRYFKHKGQWRRLLSIDEETGQRDSEVIRDEETLTAEDKIANELAKFRADMQLPETDWWKDNHYEAYEFDKETKSYFPVQTPIYIWMRTEPRDESYLKEKQPSIKFKKYQLNDDMMNPNHQEIYPWVPMPKEGKFVNEDYNKLRDSTNSADQALYKYLEFMRSEYKKGQQFYPDAKFMGDIFPGIIKTNDELRVDATNNFFSPKILHHMLNYVYGAEEDQSTQLLLGGSQSKFYSNSRILPTRFTDIVDFDKQSADIPSMILTFIQAARTYNKHLDIQPILESARILVQNLPVQEIQSRASRFNLRNVVNYVKGSQQEQKQYITKETQQSNLAKTMDYLLSTFLYEERKDPSVVKVMGQKVDLQKTSSGLKRLSSMSIFSLNAFVAIKNTLSAKIQSVINSNVGRGFYTNTDYAKAQVKAGKYVKSYWADYTKFGDKSIIGQAIQYFQVLHGATYNEYGKKTQWTHLKNWPNYLTWMKNSSEWELQVTQFLAMSEANQVELGDGSKVSMMDAFELKDGTFTLKKGAKLTDDDIKSFTKRLSFINRYINGAYREDEKNKAQKSVLGDLAFYLNGFVMPGFVNRFGGQRYSVEADILTKGYYRQGARFIGDLVKYRQGILKQWGDMTAEEKGRVLRFGKELGFLIAFSLLALAMGAGAPPKDLKKNDPFYNFLLAQMIAVKSETETFAPFPTMGTDELARKINSPFVALRQITNIIKVLNNGFLYVIQDQDGFYKSTSAHDGFHDKGDPKVVANFLRLIGYTGTAFDPLRKLETTRNLQTLK